MMATVIDAWNRFWFEKRSTETLCLFRIFFGLVFLMKMTGFSNLQHVGQLSARFPSHKFKDISTYYMEVFRLPVPGFSWLPVPELWQYQALEYILMIAAVFFIIGLFTRTAGSTIALIWLYQFLLSQWIYRHHVMVILVVMLIMAWSRSDDHFSVASYLRGKRVERPLRMILPIRMLQVSVCIIYLFSFLGKLNPGWITGDIMLVFRHQYSVQGDFRELLNWFFAFPAMAGFEDISYRSLAWFTLFVEGLLVFGFWIPRLMRFSILMGIVLHLGIDLTMSVATFSFQMFALYTVFVRPEAGSTLVLYDGTSARAAYWMRWCRLFDWLRRFSWVDLREASPDQREGLDLELAKGRLVVREADGRFQYGYRSFVALCKRFPLTFLPSWILRVPCIGRK